MEVNLVKEQLSFLRDKIDLLAVESRRIRSKEKKILWRKAVKEDLTPEQLEVAKEYGKHFLDLNGNFVYVKRSVERRNEHERVAREVHRRYVVRPASRHNQLAYAFLRDMHYASIEGESKSVPDWAQVWKVVKTFSVMGTDFVTLEKKFDTWVTNAEEVILQNIASTIEVPDLYEIDLRDDTYQAHRMTLATLRQHRRVRPI